MSILINRCINSLLNINLIYNGYEIGIFQSLFIGKIISSDLFTYKNMVDRIAKKVGGKCPVLEKNAENGVVLKNFTDFGCRVGKVVYYIYKVYADTNYWDISN